ncbi:ATP-binding cassette domain-containing protein, partial [Mesorhizobium sp. M8A.F.Ca.ET.197.01.1.1]
VNLKHVVNALENGIDTWIGEGGEMLSGGQMRRIELSRLLLLQPDVLIFDEPATGLDVQTEHVIQSVINKKFENTTIITIAHRENTIKNADRRIKINEGSVESIKVIKQNA